MTTFSTKTNLYSS